MLRDGSILLLAQDLTEKLYGEMQTFLQPRGVFIFRIIKDLPPVTRDSRGLSPEETLSPPTTSVPPAPTPLFSAKLFEVTHS
jgi:hypothetical protein